MWEKKERHDDSEKNKKENEPIILLSNYKPTDESEKNRIGNELSLRF